MSKSQDRRLAIQRQDEHEKKCTCDYCVKCTCDYCSPVIKKNEDMDRLKAELATSQERVKELEGKVWYYRCAIEWFRDWRKSCWSHDEDMGHERRIFLDEEEWEKLEAYSEATLKEGGE